jgi:ribosome-binding protein aMBF1 (putative translation factor)
MVGAANEEQSKHEELDRVRQRREYLRKKKRESRLRAQQKRRTLDPTAPDQITLTLSTGAKAIIKHAAKKDGISASEWIERLVMNQSTVVQAAYKDMPSLFQR